MNTLPIKDELTDEVKKVGEVSQEKQIKWLGNMKINKGHKLFEVNQILGTITEAEFHKTDIHYNTNIKKGKRSKKVIVKEDCTYIPALNRKNAARKYVNALIKNNSK